MGLWARLMKRHHNTVVDEARELSQMSPEERSFATEDVEDHQSTEEAKAHFGGIDPDRMLGD